MKLLSPKLPLFLALAFACAVAATAQLKAPNANGVSMGAVDLTVRDFDANIAFFKQLGGTPVKSGSIQLIEFPGVFVELEKGEPSGPTIGSIVDHIGFQVQHMQDWLPKWQAAGITIEKITRPTQAYLHSPDDVRIEILEEPTIAAPIAFHHVHFFTSDVPAMQALYVKTFGAIAGKRAQFQAADLPGVNLTFSPSQSPTVPTASRAVNSIDFEVKDLKAFLATLQSAGIKIDEPYKRASGSSLATATIADPWGTTIRLSEGLASIK